MKIGLIVYSKSGNTMSAAKVLKERLGKDGHDVSVIALSEDTVPETNYDAVVLCTPVHGGRPAEAMSAYLGKADIEGKNVAFLVTGAFPPAMGGVMTAHILEDACKAKGATVRGFGCVGWWGFKRAQKIENAANAVADCLNGITE